MTIPTLDELPHFYQQGGRLSEAQLMQACDEVAQDMLLDQDDQRIEHYGKLDAWMADDAHFYWTLWQMTLSMTTLPQEALDLWVRQATTTPLRGPFIDTMDDLQFN